MTGKERAEHFKEIAKIWQENHILCPVKDCLGGVIYNVLDEDAITRCIKCKGSGYFPRQMDLFDDL